MLQPIFDDDINGIFYEKLNNQSNYILLVFIILFIFITLKLQRF